MVTNPHKPFKSHFYNMSRHAAFADDHTVMDEEKHAAMHYENDGASIAQTGTRGSEGDKHSEAGLVHKEQNAKAERKLLRKLGELALVVAETKD